MKSHKPEYFSYAAVKAAGLRKSGRKATALNYEKSSLVLRQFLGGEGATLPFHQITVELVLSFERYLREKGLCPSSVSFHNRVFRSIYNQAVRDGLVWNTHPFDNSYTKVVPPKRMEMVEVDGIQMEMESLSKADIIHQYFLLAEKHNRLIRSMTELARGIV